MTKKLTERQATKKENQLIKMSEKIGKRGTVSSHEARLGVKLCDELMDYHTLNPGYNDQTIISCLSSMKSQFSKWIMF